MIARLFPFLHDFSDYSLRDFKGDFLAALTLTPMAAPLAMAYAVIAGVPPQYGIYTCMLPVIVAALWGSSRFLAAGPTNATSLVLFSALGTVSVAGVPLLQLPEPVRMSVIFGIALFCGLIQIVMGLMRLGEIANYISHSVMSAFGASMALLIAAGQLTTVLGIAPPQSGGFFFQVANAAARLAELPALCRRLADRHVTLYADPRARTALEGRYPAPLLQPATDESFGTEFLDYKMAIRTVDSLDEALRHIARYGSKHSECIVSESEERIARFLRTVDAACVYANVSTAFTDGAQFGLGAEIGISTQKLHARGPMALAELCTYKWIIRGDGQVRE